MVEGVPRRAVGPLVLRPAEAGAGAVIPVVATAHARQSLEVIYQDPFYCIKTGFTVSK